MNQKNYLILDNEFLMYCKLNGIDDSVKFAQEIFNQGFNIVKYGETPIISPIKKDEPKEVKTEVVIKEVIKEVINHDENTQLKEENQNLKNEIHKITSILESFGKKGKIMKDSNLSSLYDE